MPVPEKPVGLRGDMDWKQLKELIELVSEKGFAEFEVERQGFRLRISNLRPPQASLRNSSGSAFAPEVDPEYPVEDANSASAEAPAVNHPAPVSRPAVKQSGPSSAEPGLRTLKSPIVGTFYRSPSPQAEPFVKVGDRVEPESVVCIIEAMKLMNEIQAEMNGQIAEIYVENGQAVEFDQPLFGIRI